MQICCLDLEGVLLPEIWIAVADHFHNDDLRLTTRDISNYDQLMGYRLNILRKNRIRLADIQDVIGGMKPLPGAKTFITDLQRHFPVTVLLSDTFYEFAMPLIQKLGNPTLLCNWLKVSRAGYISGYVLRQRDGKRKAVKAFKGIGFNVVAAGDSYNDLSMLRTADRGVLFNPPDAIARQNPEFPVARDYATLARLLKQ
jgi:phosphoserine/homoserine phosphotransferase